MYAKIDTQKNVRGSNIIAKQTLEPGNTQNRGYIKLYYITSIQQYSIQPSKMKMYSYCHKQMYNKA